MLWNRSGRCIALFAVLSIGCATRELAPINPCVTTSQRVDVPQIGTDKVDLLFVIDDSGSMQQEQDSLGAEVERLVSVLASGVFAAGTARERVFPAVSSLRVGVVSTDMGTSGRQGACRAGFLGQDGRLRASEACGTTRETPFLTFEHGDAVEPFAQRVRCLASLGTEGCGFEQQLEAALKAVTPSTSELRFAAGDNGVPTTGHGDTLNGGFVRDDAILAVVMLTDEDDCSAIDPDLFLPFTAEGPNPYPERLSGLRCSSLAEAGPYTNAIHPVERYVDGLLAVKQDPRLFVFASIVGVPTRLVPARDEETDYSTLVGPGRDPSLVEALNVEGGRLNELEPIAPSCTSDNGRASPPLRILEVAQGIEAQNGSSVVQSICQENFEPALDAIIERLIISLTATCLPRPLNRDASGRVSCEVVETQAFETAGCDESRGRFAQDVDGDGIDDRNDEGRLLCTVCQTQRLADGTFENADPRPGCARRGWFYETGDSLDDVCPESRRQRVSFIEGDGPLPGTAIRVRCLTQSSSAEGAASPGSGCGTAFGPDPSLCEGAAPGLELTCDPRSNRCEQYCSQTGECTERGLAGYVCSIPLSGGDQSVCLNPTCLQQ